MAPGVGGNGEIRSSQGNKFPKMTSRLSLRTRNPTKSCSYLGYFHLNSDLWHKHKPFPSASPQTKGIWALNPKEIIQGFFSRISQALTARHQCTPRWMGTRSRSTEKISTFFVHLFTAWYPAVFNLVKKKVLKAWTAGKSFSLLLSISRFM